MAKVEKWETPAPGIRCRISVKRMHRGRPDRYFTLRFKLAGKEHHERLGWASDGWNLAKAKTELAKLKAAAATGEGPVTLRERREAAQKEREAALNAPTVQSVWEAYRLTLRGRVLGNSDGYVRNHLQAVMPMKIEALRTCHIDALRKELTEKGLAAATVRLILALIRQIVFWGAKHGFNRQPMLHELYFPMPKVDNLITENLTDEQLFTFLTALDNYPEKTVAASMKLALLTGIRRFALFSLRWDDVDFINKHICLRGEHAKNGKTEFIPLTPAVEELLNNIQPVESELIFGQTNFQSRSIKKLIEYVKPFLPAGFRPYHGLRHCYASRLASGGASLFEIQKLLTHGNASMTQRYAHLCDSSLRRAANIMSDELKRVSKSAAQKPNALKTP